MSRVNICFILFLFSLISIKASYASPYSNYHNGFYDKAYPDIQKIAQDGNPKALYYLGLMNLKGNGVKINNKQGLKYLKQSAKMGYVPAAIFMGQYALNIEDSPQQALNWYSIAAKKGNIDGYMYLAASYLNGLGTKVSKEKARRNVLNAAKKGSTYAQNALAERFLRSRHRGERRMGYIWLKKAAENGQPDAQYELGYQLLKGPKRYADPKKAYYYLSLAAKQNHIKAQKTLSEMYQTGKGVEKNEVLAKKWMSLAQDNMKNKLSKKDKVMRWLDTYYKKHPNQQHQYVKGLISALPNIKQQRKPSSKMQLTNKDEIFSSKLELINPSTVEIKKLHEIISKNQKDFKDKEFYLPEYDVSFKLNKVDNWLSNKKISGVFQFNNQGKLDGFESLETFYYSPFNLSYWQHATAPKHQLKNIVFKAVHGNPRAQMLLGKVYEKGIGVKQNLAEAIRWYKLASKQNDTKADYNIGIIYLKYLNDVDTALKWFKYAAFKGNRNAQYALASLYYHDIAGEDHPNKERFAKTMYGFSAWKNLPIAQYKYAKIISLKDNEYTVSERNKNHKMIKDMYEKAVSGGIEDAKLPLAFYYASDKSNVNKHPWALKVAQEKANQGNNKAALLLAIMNDRGIGSIKNESNALQWYQFASSNGDPIAQFILGTYYYTGEKLGKDDDKAIALLQNAANSGIPYANYNLAAVYYMKNYDFLPYLYKSANQNFSQAALFLADYSLQNANHNSMILDAAKTYKNLASLGYADAQLKLGYLYDKGLGVGKDKQLARDWYIKSAKQDNKYAQFLLGNLYHTGGLGKVNIHNALKWYKASAKNGFMPANLALGFVHENYLHDYPSAQFWYNKAAQANNPLGMYNLASVQQHLGNYHEAEKWYKKAIEHNVFDAKLSLANLYHDNANKISDYKKAFYWYKQLASNQYPQALYRLGQYYESGVATEPDMEKSLSFYNQAANQGHELANLALARIHDYGFGVEKNKSLAFDRYQNAAKTNNGYAQFKLAKMYYEGIAVDQNIPLARDLLKVSAQNGYSQAQHYLNYINANNDQTINSYIFPIFIDDRPFTGNDMANIDYLYAISAFDRGQTRHSKKVIRQMVKKYPEYQPAKRAEKTLNVEKFI